MSMLRGAALWAAHVANAWRPMSRRGRASFAAVCLGFAPSELPRAFGVLQLLWTARAARRGGLRQRSAPVSLALTGASFVGLVALDRSARRAGPILDAALVEALGCDAAIPQPEVVPSSVRKVGVLGMSRAHRRYVTHGPLAYGPEVRRNAVDVWRRSDLPRDGRAPVLVQIPGGAWISGAKRPQGYPLMSHLAELGWVCVSISYAQSPRSRWPQHLVDVKRAIAWVKDNIALHGGDPEFVAVTGGSAGGHLCAMAALTANDPTWQPGFEPADTSVRAAVPLYGAYDWTEDDALGHRFLLSFLERVVVGQPSHEAADLFSKASPMRNLRPDAPPFFVLHGENDALLPIEQADRFVARLRDISEAPVAYARLPKAGHGFDVLGTQRAAECASAVARFLGVVHRTYRASRPPR